MKKKRIDYSSLTKEKIEEACRDLFYGKSYPEMRESKTPYIRKLGENSWEIFDGLHLIRTNGGGKALFDKAIQEQYLKLKKK